MKLQPNILWDECQGGVLGGSNLVTGIGEVEVTFFVALGFGDRDIEIDRSVLASSRLLGNFTFRVGAVIRLALLVSHLMSLVKPVHDGDTFPYTTGAGLARGGPSLSFGWFRDVTRDLTNFARGFDILLSWKAHRSHLGYECTQIGHTTRGNPSRVDGMNRDGCRDFFHRLWRR